MLPARFPLRATLLLVTSLPLPAQLPMPVPAAPASVKLPAWMRPGAVVSVWGVSATIPGVSTQLVRNDDGEWVDPATGKRYSNDPTVGAGGCGIVQHTLVHAGPDAVAFDSRSYLWSNLHGDTYTLVAASSHVGTAEAVADIWQHPAKLARLTGAKAEGVRVLRFPYTIDGRTYDSVTIETKDGSGFARNTYDLVTGLLVAQHASSVGGSVPYIHQNGGTVMPGAGYTTITTAKLVAIRHPDLPWGNDPVPGALRSGGTLEYRGTQSLAIPEGPPFVSQLGISVTFGVPTDGWARAGLCQTLDTGFGMAPQELRTDRCLAACTPTPPWLAPGTLAKLRPDQVIDEDRVTGTRVTWLGARRGVGMLLEQRPRESYEFSYDLGTGLLVAIAHRQQQGIGQVSYRVGLVTGGR